MRDGGEVHGAWCPVGGPYTSPSDTATDSPPPTGEGGGRKEEGGDEGKLQVPAF